MHRPSQQIERELNELRRKLQFQELPSITVLEAAVQRWTSRTVLDAIHRPDLQQADQALREAQEMWAQRARDNTSLKLLENELSESIAARRIELATQADNNLSRAIGEYQAACLIAAKSLRQLLNAQHQSQQVPGAQSNLQHMRLDQFNIPHLIPMSWQGTLGHTMLQGTAQFEQPLDFAIRPNLKVA
jgi:hypothetical protein